jgi:hypothetical protein
MHVAEKMHDVFRPSQQWHVPLDDDPVKTVIYKNKESFKQLPEGFHRSPPQIIGWIPKSSAQATGGINRGHPQFRTPSPWDFKGAALGYA